MSELLLGQARQAQGLEGNGAHPVVAACDAGAGVQALGLQEDDGEAGGGMESLEEDGLLRVAVAVAAAWQQQQQRREGEWQ